MRFQTGQGNQGGGFTWLNTPRWLLGGAEQEVGQRLGLCLVLLAPQQSHSINIFGQRTPCSRLWIPRCAWSQTDTGGFFFFFPSLKMKRNRKENSEQRKSKNDPVSFSDSNLNICQWLWKSISFWHQQVFYDPFIRNSILFLECSCFKSEYINQNNNKKKFY